MKIDGINHRIGITATLDEVYAVLTGENGISGWWGPTKIESQEGGDIVSVRFPSVTMNLRVASLIPKQSVTWEPLNIPSWKGTEIHFDLYADGAFAIILFSHRGWDEKLYEHMAHCSTKWVVFLLSLKSLLEEGKGLPSPYDRKIDNWN